MSTHVKFFPNPSRFDTKKNYTTGISVADWRSSDATTMRDYTVYFSHSYFPIEELSVRGYVSATGINYLQCRGHHREDAVVSVA